MAAAPYIRPRRGGHCSEYRQAAGATAVMLRTIFARRTICDGGVKILRRASAVTLVTETIAVRVSNIFVSNQEVIMSLLYHSNEKADLKRTDYTDRTDHHLNYVRRSLNGLANYNAPRVRISHNLIPLMCSGGIT
jgi:hypothetical protein